jgi:hypothetical protein
MQLLIHFLGGENSLIVHLEFKVGTDISHKNFYYNREESSSRGPWMVSSLSRLISKNTIIEEVSGVVM